MGGKLSTGVASGGSNQSPQRPGVSTQPRASVTHRGSTRPRHEFLDDDEPDIIRKHWKMLKSGDTQSMGIRIFLRIFEIEPKTQNAFTSLRGMEPDELVTNVLFRSHSMRFMQAVEGTVLNLEALDVIIVPNLHQLGRRHTHFSGFKPEYMKAFEQAMDETWLHELGSTEYNGKARQAWQKIFQLITTTVLGGYNENLPKLAAKCPIAEKTCPAAETTNNIDAVTETIQPVADAKMADKVTTTTTNNTVANNICENKVLGHQVDTNDRHSGVSVNNSTHINCTELSDGKVCPENNIDKNNLQLVT